MNMLPKRTIRARSAPNATQDWVRALAAVKQIELAQGQSLTALIRAQCHGDTLALRGEHGELSYPALLARCDAYAYWAQEQDIPLGVTLGLYMHNAPEYAAIWLGLIQAGYVVALLNTNLTGEALLHAIRIANATHIITSAKLAPALLKYLVNATAKPAVYIDSPKLKLQTGVEFSGPPIRSQDTALLVYTSGTTGLPKACKISHGRIRRWSAWFCGMMDVTPTDRLYNCLPMYHSTGGIVAIGAMLLAGGSVVLRERFSAQHCWADMAAQNCTIFQYIGELCRYLVAQPERSTDRQHHLRLCCGNGLREDVWKKFEERFAIPRILEFYAATEGNFSLYNCEAQPGAVGRVPPFLAQRFPIALIRYDADTVTALRGPDGLCIPTEPGEPGEAIAKIDNAGASFDGYTDPQASSAKILRDVFAPGDAWLRSGDAMRRDAEGYYYFVDRLGDSFRWKGENVSASEVETVISGCPGITGAVVFGVAVPGCEGRAGMAAITAAADFDMPAAIQHIKTNLPDYARPRFLRQCLQLASTATYKFQKADLKNAGYQLDNTEIWLLDYRCDMARRLTPSLRTALETGQYNL